MRDLMILGIGPHASEMADIVARVNAVEQTWNLLGYVSPDGQQADELLNGHPVLGRMAVLDEHLSACVVPHGQVSERKDVPRERLVSLIDPSAFIANTAEIGLGCVLFPHCFVGHNARLGDFVFSLAGSNISHDDVIEERVILASGVTLAGSVHVEADCYLGQACNIKQHVTIGRGSLIGLGAVVINDVAPNSIMVGNPARWLREHNGSGIG